ncbi:hypothetical protein C2G38_2030294 [Gigaspora rosea]|uniref:Uncharacterized protein n=1 Tax=Gigaspora rosea TaxID=44941 RepID=A0A397W246_9GLOM|nr:hypothetical protein C2G38_2030294 [Gigaspora rosea]
MPTNIDNCAEYSLDKKVVSTAPKNDRTPKKLLDKFSIFRLVGVILGICLITLLLLYYFFMQDGQNISQSETHTFQSIVDLADSGSEKLSSLEIPETGEMSGYRIIIRDLGLIMEKSDIMVKNGKKISEVLFGLDKEIQKAGDELEEFRHQAKIFYFSLASEMKAIMKEIENSQSGFKYFSNLIKSNNHMSDSEANFINKRLEILENQIPGFLEQTKRVLYAIDSVHNSADNTQGYLIDGEREAERALKKHWLGNIADYTVRMRAEDELLRVRVIIKMLKEIAPSLLNFETFLKEYRRNIQDVSKEVINVPIRPTEEDLKYLKKAIADLEEQHEQFSSAKKKFISMDDYNARYLEENQSLDEQHTIFSSEEYKPDEDVENEDAENNDSMLYAFTNKILEWTLYPVVFIIFVVFSIVKYIILTLFSV